MQGAGLQVATYQRVHWAYSVFSCVPLPHTKTDLGIIGQVWVFCLFVLRLLTLCLSVLPITLSVYHVYAWCLWRSEKSIGSLELEFQIVMNYTL